MTSFAIASTALHNAEAARDLLSQISEQLESKAPEVLIVFASPDNDYEVLLGALNAEHNSALIVGCSSAGEFTNADAGTGRTSLVALHAPEMQFNAALAEGLAKGGGESAAAQLLQGFKGVQSTEFRYRTGLLLVDALAGHTEEMVDQLTIATGGMYQFVGGGAGDDARFSKTHVFLGAAAFTDAAVALEILSNKPIGIGARHGWSPASAPMRVTESEGSAVKSLNISPAIEAFEEHALASKQEFDRENPMPFFLHNIVGVKTDGGHKLRVPLGISDSGGIMCAAEVPSGSTAQIMSIGASSASDAASDAVRDAMEQVTRAGHKPKAALFFDCVATRLRLGEEFANELDAVSDALGPIPFAGFNSYGQIVRAEGQFSGFHNCTAVACVFPE